ncbi:MAG: AmmeMemoRadiSam system protein B [Patescibacteria group bacterium]|nr:AmmeMemoRadiSam system protein B [Patescibacteria group bacterium]
MRRRIKITVIAAAAALAAAVCAWLLWPRLERPARRALPIAAERPAIAAQFNDKNFFLTAIKQSTSTPLAQRVTGIVVPHHLLARDVIADVFLAASGGDYQRVVVISPDHFQLGASPISFAAQDFNTPFGRLATDQDFIDQLAALPQAQAADFFYREHGIGAELPFVKYFFPNAKITAIALSIHAQPRDLGGLIELLKNIAGPKTLIVQSTDFSHYLTAGQADIKDAQTTAVLKKIDQGANLSEIYQLTEPDNLDCLACQYVQSSVQASLNSRLHIVDYKNSQDYTADKVSQTTSYIPQVYY